jgi:hypothetical protein
MELKKPRVRVQTGTIYPYIPLTTPPQPNLLHSTPQDASDCPEKPDIADFMVLDGYA